MADKMRESFDFGSLSIILGVSFIIFTIVWIIMVNILSEERSNEVTWVG